MYTRNHVKSRLFVLSGNSAHSAAVASYPPPPPQAAEQMMQHSAAAADYFRDAAGQLVTYHMNKFRVMIAPTVRITS